MTEPSSDEAEVPIEPIGDSPTPDENTDAQALVDENDRVEDFPAEETGWPDDPPRFEVVAFSPESGPQLDEGAK